MRRTMLAGLALAVAAPLVVLVSAVFDLDLDSTVLLGVAVGGVVGLVPDRSPALRLGGFAAGFLVALVGYLVRAAVLPDSDAGRAVAVALVLVVCAGIAAVSRDRVPFWGVLLGAGAFVGAYEHTFAAAPPEVVSTSVSTATQLLFTVAVGFLAAALATSGRPAVESRPGGPGRALRRNDDADNKLDDLMMEKTQ